MRRPRGGLLPCPVGAEVRRNLPVAALFVFACLAGLGAAEWICRSVYLRDQIGTLFSRGRLLALVEGTGIYEADLLRATEEFQNRTGTDDPDPVSEEPDESAVLSELVADLRLEKLARNESISDAAVDQACALLEFQLRPAAAWEMALRRSGVSGRFFHEEIASGMRARGWIERKILAQIRVTAAECRQFYETHAACYAQPLRFRASHIFVAAPLNTPAEVVEAKRRTIEMLFDRLAHGEEFANLALVRSEDEATKTRGGDLGFFSEARMPADFIASIKGMLPGETSGVVRSRLGFHLVRLTEVRAGQQMAFDQAQSGIALKLENEKRQAALQDLQADFGRGSEFRRSRPQ